MKRIFRRSFIISAVGYNPEVLRGGGRLGQKYIDQRAKAVVHYPTGWRIDPERQNFTLVSFNPNRRPRQILVPLNQGQIVLLSPPDGVGSVDAWLHRDRASPATGYDLQKRLLTTAGVPNCEVTTTTIHYSNGVIPQGVNIKYFFVVRGRLLALALLYRGRSREQYFESVLNDIAATLELLD